MKRLAYLTLALAAILINGCSNESLETKNVEKNDFKKSLEFIILEEEALKDAKDFLNRGNVETRNASNAEVKTIWRTITLSNETSSRSATENETVEVPVYVVSYSDENGNPDGYVVMVGDKRVIDKVLVFSEEGTWGVSDIPEFENLFWSNVDYSLAQTLSASDIDPCDTYEYEELGEVVKFAMDFFLIWGQSPSPYNDSVPICNTTSNKLAGCVAVAMGQIMAHHEHPYTGSYIHQQYNLAVNATYDWNKIKASTDATALQTEEGKNGVANILAEIGYKVNMDYGCTISLAYSDSVPGTFNEMGYTSSDLEAFNLQEILDDIDSDQPVYICGRQGDSGHAWIVEGYKQFVNNLIYGRDCPDGQGESIPPTIISSEIVSNYLYFNLGWNGYKNGFFLADIFDGWDYPTNVKIIHDIKPNI